MEGLFDNERPGYVRVRVSVPMMFQMFHQCTLPFITKVCKGYCCEASTGISVFAAPGAETARVEALGAVVIDNLIQPDARGLCPFKSDDGLCTINDKKPFQCSISPFCLSKTDTIIVRNRFRRLLCYKCGNSLPAYQAHRWSLTNVVGTEGIDELVRNIERARARGERVVPAYIEKTKYDILCSGRDTRPAKPVPSNTRKANSPIRENLAKLDIIDGISPK